MSFVRRRRTGVIAAAIILSLALLPRGSGPALAGDPDVNGALAQQQQMEQQLAKQRDALASLVHTQATLSTDLQRISDNLTAVGVAIAQAETQLNSLALQLQQAQVELDSYKVQIQGLAVDLANVSEQIQVSTKQLATQEALLQEHLRAAYRESQVSVLEVVLSSQSFTETASVVGNLLSLSDGDQALAAQIRSTQHELQIREATLHNGQATLNALEAGAAQRTNALNQQQEQLAAARTALNRKKAQLEQLQASEQTQLAVAAANADAYRLRIAEQEAALAGQAQLVAQLKAEANKLDIAYHGRFEWPLHGDFIVTQEFGHTQFEYFHSGIDMAYLHPTCGGPIYAAADGTVLAAGRPELAFGDTAIGVIIGHSQRLQTWYWHLSREIVSVGQTVQAGQLIGYEGATGWATGCHLHFQVMFDGHAVNPRSYLP